MPSVLLVDNQPSVRHGLRLLLGLEREISVVGEAGSGAEALAAADALDPDLVIMDVEMPGMDGLAAAKQLSRLHPRSALIILTMHNGLQISDGAVAAGAIALVSKSRPQDLLNTVRVWLRKEPAASMERNSDA
jgi:DNA-binding NarL/FixJ family response regulator